MAEQNSTGRWVAKRAVSGGVKVRIFDTQDEAEEWEK